MMRINKYYISQIDEKDCGIAALATIFKRYGSDYSLAHLRQLARTDLEGTTALGLVKTAQKLNFNTKAIKADMSIFNNKHLPYPFIAHVLKDKKYYHYYVVYGMNSKYIKIADPDPDDRIRKVSKEKFRNEWSGVALFIAPNVNYQPVKEKHGSLWNYTNLLFKQKNLIFNIVIAAFLITIIGIVGSYYFQILLDNFIPNQAVTTISTVSIGLVIAYIFQQILSFGQNYLLTVLGQRLSIDVILNLCQ